LAHFARSVRYTGEFGTGSKLKYVANLLIAVHTLAAAEAMALGEKAGIDPATLVETLCDSAAKSRMFEVRAPHMVDASYSTPMMKLDVFQKDLDIIGEFAKHTLCPVPLFTASLPFYLAARAQGMGGCDIGAVHAVLQRLAGQTPAE
jgi:L-threonate 2-dehydrogenase